MRDIKKISVMRYFLQHKKPQLILGFLFGLYFLLSFLRLL